jgi:hypothetical protein
MKKDILKIAGVKSEAEFYKKFPTEAAFMKVHGKEFKKAKMGAAMVKKQLTQLTDFSNPPQAEMGSYIGGDSTGYQNINFGKTYGDIDSSIGVRSQMEEMRDKIDYLKQQDQMQSSSAKSEKGDGGGDKMEKVAQAAKVAGMVAGGVPPVKRGGKIPKYQNAGKPLLPMPSAGQFAQSDYDITNQFNQNNPGANIDAGVNPNYGQQPAQQPQQKQPTSLATTSGGRLIDKAVKLTGPFAKPIGKVINAGRQIKQSIDQAAQARQAGNLSKLALQASSTRPEETKRRYNRPEDAMVDPGQVSPSYGTGYSPMQATAEYGAEIGGNPTEVQNMYNPGDMYMDLGYAPLNDNDKVKQYRKGGNIPKALPGAAVLAIANKVGDAAQVAGDVGSGLIDMGTERRMNQNQQILGQTAFQSATQGMQNQNAAFMEDGGWVSHNWQPQVITQFGGYNLKDLLKPDPTMDTLRSGGHLKNYAPPSEQAMSTERPEMAMGGQLKTTWGGYAEPISHNPYLPGSGETVMFRGKSHEESDGNGHTGIGVKYGGGGHDSYTDYAEYGTEQADADVEVERGEPATELMDKATGETSMIVYGDMKIPSYGVSELRDPKAKGKKFKNYANDLSKIEKRQTSILEKAIDKLAKLDPTTPFEKLEFDSLSKVADGANMKLKGLAAQKELLAGIQNAILDTSKEFGLKSAELAKGKIQQDPDSEMAKFGGKFTQAQNGKKSKKKPTKAELAALAKLAKTMKYAKPTAAQLAAEDAQFRLANPEPEIKPPTLAEQVMRAGIGPKVDPIDSQKLTGVPTAVELAAMDAKWRTNSGGQDSDLTNLWREVQPYLIPSNQQPFDAGQITPEMMALATNQLEPVYAQTFKPLLETPYSVSMQDQLNANQADFNALQRQMGYNPAAAAALAAQKYAANSAILAQQLRANQELQMGAYNRNRGILNDATLKNFGILDQQQQRQSQAKSATKAQAQAALSSIADKIAKHKLENRTLGVYENMYNYRFGPNGKAINVNAPYQFNLDVASLNPEDKKASKSTGKNGSIVKAIKNL